MPAKYRCAEPACTRWAMADTSYCSNHQPRSAQDALPSWARESLDVQLARSVLAAGEDPRLDGELGMIRSCLADVLTEELLDTKTRAILIAKLALAAASIARTRRTLSGDQADGLTEALTTILLELEPTA